MISCKISGEIRRARRWLLPVVVMVTVLLGAGGCRQGDRLLLLDVRASGGLPTSVASVRFSADGWPTRSVAGVLGPAGLLFGYYGPSGSGDVTVTAEAVDASNCVLGDGTVTVLDTSSGKATAPTVLYVRPRVDTACVLPDAGVDAPGDSGDDAPSPSDAGDGGGADADARADAEGGTDTRGDSPGETGGEVGGDAADAGTDADASPVRDGGNGDADGGALDSAAAG